MKAELKNTDNGCDIKLSSENRDEEKILSTIFDAISKKNKISSYSKRTSSLANDTEIILNIKR